MLNQTTLIRFVCLLSVCFAVEADWSDSYTYRPVVFWHGMGDTSKGSLVHLQKIIEAQLNHSVFTYSIIIGNTQTEDFWNTYFKNSNEQIDIACKQIQQIPELDNGFTLIGFSQGGQFARALIQRCDLAGPLALITLGAQHQGVFGLPSCTTFMCNYIREMINMGAYESYVQNHLVQAQYWHDSLDEKTYVKKSKFLADINNEREQNDIYRQRMIGLERFVMVQFDNDTIVIPKESSLFGFYAPGQQKEIVPMEQTSLYQEDRIGLKYLNDNNRLIQLHTKGNHLQVNDDWFVENIVDAYLKIDQ